MPVSRTFQRGFGWLVKRVCYLAIRGSLDAWGKYFDFDTHSSTEILILIIIFQPKS